MRRIISLLAAMAIMAAMLVAMAMPAFAGPPLVSGGGAQDKGAVVFHCKALGVDDLKGNQVRTPNGNIEGPGCRFDF